MATATNKFESASYPGNYNIGRQGVNGESTYCVRYWDTTVTNLAAASYKVCTIPAGSLVSVRIVPIVGEATVTLAWGDAGTANSLKAAAVIATGVTQTTNVLYYAADDEVQFTSSGAFVAAKFWTIVEIIGAKQVSVL